MREPAVLAVVGLREPWRLVPVDGFAGVGENDQVADLFPEPFADCRAEDALLDQLGDAVHLRAAFEKRLERRPDVVVASGSGVQEEISARPCGCERSSVGADLEVVDDLGPELVDVQAAFGSIAAMPWSAVIRTSVPSGRRSA